MSAGSLGFSVMIFFILAVAAIGMLVIRRKYGGELGGATRKTQVREWKSGACLELWESTLTSHSLSLLLLLCSVSYNLHHFNSFTLSVQWLLFAAFISLWLLFLMLTGLFDYGWIPSESGSSLYMGKGGGRMREKGRHERGGAYGERNSRHEGWEHRQRRGQHLEIHFLSHT